MYNIPVVNRNITHKLRSSTVRLCRCSYIAGKRTLARPLIRSLAQFDSPLHECVTHAFGRTSFWTQKTNTAQPFSLYVRLWVVCIWRMAVTIHSEFETPQYYCILNLIRAYQNRRWSNNNNEKKSIIQLIFVCHSSESGAFLLLNFYLFSFVWLAGAAISAVVVVIF